MGTLNSSNLSHKVSSTHNNTEDTQAVDENDTVSISSQPDPNFTDSTSGHQIEINDTSLSHNKRTKSPRNSNGSKRSRPRRSYSFSDSENEEMSRESFNKSTSSAQQLMERDHPFPPMVNRDMLCILVRRAFHQTEEQQIQFEQILRHEYGRKSKGEVSYAVIVLIIIWTH